MLARSREDRLDNHREGTMVSVSYGFFDVGGTLSFGRLAGLPFLAGVADMAATPDGGFVAVLDYGGHSYTASGDPDGATDAVLVQRFDAAGRLAGEPVVLGLGDPGLQYDAQVAVAPDGRIFVAYASNTVLYEDVGTIEVAALGASMEIVTAPRTVVFADEATNAVVPSLAYDATSDRIYLAAFASFEGDALIATLDGALSVVATNRWDGAVWDTTPLASAVLTSGELILAGAARDVGLEVIQIWPSERMAGFPTPQVFDTPAALAALPTGGFVLARAIPDQPGDLAVDFYDLDGRRVASNIVAEAGGAEDVNVEVLPTGHVVTFHRASFGVYGDDLVVANAFAPNGALLIEDVLLTPDAGAYYDVEAAALVSGRVAVSWYDGLAAAGPEANPINDLLLLDFVRLHEAEGDIGETFEGDDLTDAMFGGGGNDTMQAGGGNDLLEGGAGTDLLVGGIGSDTIYGGDGADIIYGDGGAA